MQEHIRLGLAQCPFGVDVEAVCRSAAEQGCDILVFPEMYSNGYARYEPESEIGRRQWIAGTEPLDGAYVDRFRRAAQDHDLHIVATLLERAEPKPFNSAVLIAPNGDIVLHQRKRHICFFDAPEDACQPGRSSAVTTLHLRNADVCVGVMICMDREYPDVAHDLARQGAELVLVPNSCPLVDDPDVGDIRLAGARTRAFENTMALAVANYPAPKDDGHSFAVDATGKVLKMAGTGPQLLVVDIDLGAVRKVRKDDWFRRETVAP